MKPTHVTALVALALAGLGALVFLWRASEASLNVPPGQSAAQPAEMSGVAPEGSPGEPATRSIPAARAERAQLPPPGAGPGTEHPGEETAPPGPDDTGQETATGERRPRVYVSESGTLVRDHRQRAGLSEIRGSPRRPGAVRKIDPLVVVAVRNAMRPIVHRCAGDVADGSFGAEPRLQGEVVISVAAGNLTVDEVLVKTLDVAEEAADGVRDCVIQGMLDMTLPAEGQPDLSRHTLTLPFRLRR